MATLDHEQTTVLEILKGILTLSTAVREVENTFGIIMHQTSKYSWEYIDRQREFMITLYIPVDNQVQCDEIIFDYTDRNDHYVIDSANSHLELNEYIGDALTYRLLLTE